MGYLLCLFWFACNGEVVQTDNRQIPSTAFFKDCLNELELKETEDVEGGLFAPFSGKHKVHKLSLQHFKKHNIVYLAVNDYLNIDQSESAAATTFTLTQIAAVNHSMLGGKLQLNPKNGEITIGVELYSSNGLDPADLKAAINRLRQNADDHFQMLQASMKGRFY